MKSYRVVLLGKASVGKTSIINRLINNTFEEWTGSTIGAAFHSYKNEKYNDVILEIWDTAGQERYRSLAPMYYRNSSIALIVYDITDKESFKIAKGWIQEIYNNEKNSIIALIGNKTDLLKDRKITINEILNYTNNKNILYYEVSALSGNNIKNTFNDIIEKTINNSNKFIPKINDTIKLSDYSNINSCCI